MAQQIGILKITGTIGGICFYCMDGVFYARAKSSLTRKRVKTDPAFKETMRCAKRMGNASKIASALYREMVPVHERSREKYRELVGLVMKELDAVLRWQGLNHKDAKAQRCTKKKGLTDYLKDGNASLRRQGLNHRDTKTQRNTKKKILVCKGGSAASQDEMNHRGTKTQRNTKKKILVCKGGSAASQDEMNHRYRKTRRRKHRLLTDCAEIHSCSFDFYFMRHEFHGLRRIKRRGMVTKDQDLR